MRISDWSSDVCSSDLDVAFEPTTTKPENVLLSIRSADTYGDGEPNADSSACEVYWGQTPVDSKQLLERGQAKLEKLIEDIDGRSEENTSELQSLMRISYAVFCLTK